MINCLISLAPGGGRFKLLPPTPEVAANAQGEEGRRGAKTRYWIMRTTQRHDAEMRGMRTAGGTGGNVYINELHTLSHSF